MWGVPVDHKMFSEITKVQWLWYFHNFIEDTNSEFEISRDLVEYNASFIEPDAVKKIRLNRDGQGDSNTVEVPEDEFSAGLEVMFGAALDVTDTSEKDPIKTINSNRKSFNLSYWLNTDLE